MPIRALAQDVDEVTVTARDPAGLLERKPSDTVFGIAKPLIDTPRSASMISDLTLERYGVQTIDDLTEVSPGSFTDSYYGVPGALNLRGTLAETYFHGFKRIEDRGTYPTPIGAADEIDVVRGPPTPVYGPGKVGGFLDFEPKTARVNAGYLTEPTGEIEATYGAYDQKRIDGRLGLPAQIGPVEGGVYTYVELEDSGSFYQGVHPAHQLGQISANFDLGSGWSLAFGGMGYRSTGSVQTPGWNRVTQALINNGTYTTGRNTVLVDSNGNGRLDPGEIGPGGLIDGYFGFPPGIDPRFVLNTGVGTTTLSPHTVFVSSADFNDTTTGTAYIDLVRDLGAAGTLKLQLFYDQLDNKRFVSYGFPAAYWADTVEGRASWIVAHDLGPIRTHNVFGAAWRRYDGSQRESFNGGDLSLDRRDLSYGPTPTDIFDSPFTATPGSGGPTWETYVRGAWTDAGLFATTDAALGPFDLIVGGRYDDYHVSARDDGTIVFGANPGQTYQVGQGSWTYSASLSVKIPLGLMPYVTYAHDAALEMGQAGAVPPNLLAQGGWLSGSGLEEAGIKGQGLGGTLIGSLAAYRQTRTQLTENDSVQGTIGKGLELELRWLATKNLSFTFAGNLQRTVIKGPDDSFMIIPPSVAGVPDVDGYGGAYAVYAFSQIRPGNYTDSLIPGSVASLYAVYTSDRYVWGQVGGTLGATRVSDMVSTVPGVFVLPAYVRVNASAFFARGPWRVSANIDNLFDQAYFTPVADVYANVAVLPGIGRTWRLTLKRNF